VGPVLGIIQDIPTCEVLLKRIEKEAIETIARIQGLIKTDGKL
jgi:NADH:quinone reductase (non-electrogenic)